ncbi:MAG: DUF2344 domain-containing protein [Actinobacteria bacterium]|nr:DUF2344 domain-containing protein [Actinomycetota bacterium]
MERLRVKYGKSEPLKFLSHLEVARAFEKAFKRAEFPLSFSSGFSPHPRISYGSVLPLGITSICEFLDVMLIEKLPEEKLLEKINLFLPVGLIVFELNYVSLSEPSLMSSINVSEYSVTVECNLDLAKLEEQMKNFLIRDDIFITRKKDKKISSFCLKDRLINFDISKELENNAVIFDLTVRIGEEGNLKPEEVINAFSDFCGSSFCVLDIKRTALRVLG